MLAGKGGGDYSTESLGAGKGQVMKDSGCGGWERPGASQGSGAVLQTRVQTHCASLSSGQPHSMESDAALCSFKGEPRRTLAPHGECSQARQLHCRPQDRLASRAGAQRAAPEECLRLRLWRPGWLRPDLVALWALWTWAWTRRWGCSKLPRCASRKCR